MSSLDTNLGFSPMLFWFAAAILGGFGRLGGVVIGGLLIGLAEQLLAGYLLRDYRGLPVHHHARRDRPRPQGLFARGTRERR